MRWNTLVARSVSRWLRRLQPTRPAWVGAAVAMPLLAALLAANTSPSLRLLGSPLDPLLWAALAVGCTGLLTLAVRLLQGFGVALSGWTAALLAGGAGVAGALAWLTLYYGPFGFGHPLGSGAAVGSFWGAIGVLVAVAALGGALGLAVRLRGGRRRLALGVAVLLASAHLLVVGWLISEPGKSVSAGSAQAFGVPGNLPVERWSYGSGTDHQRERFADGVALRTSPVDGSPFVEGWTPARTEYWGFEATALPLNGTVWMPRGARRAPLVLVVHGNHDMDQPSDAGYAYLGEALAARGYVVVSVDQNFLNDGPMRHGGLGRQETDARAWHLLQHLDLWRRWSQTSGHAMEGRVDLDRVALVGQSRGGEAVAVAALFNRLRRYPDDALVPFDFGFGIQAVAALAPTDGYYQPAGHPVTLEDVSYLVLQGGHDMDISAFVGSRQYRRVHFSGDSYRLKAALYLERANHGQFNTSWGRADMPWPIRSFLNLAALMPGEEQRRVTVEALLAFLGATLEQDRAALERLRRPQDLVPGVDGVVLGELQDSTFRVLANYEEDVDPTTGASGVQWSGRNLTGWWERELPLRFEAVFPSSGNHAAILTWAGGEGSYSGRLPTGLAADWNLGPGDALALSLAIPAEEVLPSEDGVLEPPRLSPPDITVEIESAGGHRAALPLRRFGEPAPVLRSQMTRPGSGRGVWQPVLQTVLLPLAAFTAVEAALDLEALVVVRLRFDRAEAGALLVDDIGFLKLHPQSQGDHRDV